MNFTLQELKDASQELEFLLEAIAKAEEKLRGGNKEYINQIRELDDFKQELTKPLSLLSKIIEDLSNIQGNIDAAISTSESSIKQSVKSYEEAIQAFEERAKNLSSIIDLSSFEKQLSDGLKEMIEEIIVSQKSHLDMLGKIAKALDESTKKFENTANHAEQRIITVERKTSDTVDKLSDKIKKLNVITITPWVLLGSVVSTVLSITGTYLYMKAEVDSAKKESAHYASMALPDEYYGSSGTTRYLMVKLNDTSRKVWKDGKTIFVEIK